MRTNIVIDDALMAEATALTGASSKRSVVELGLLALIRQRKQRAILDYEGKFNWVGDLDEMRRD